MFSKVFGASWRTTTVGILEGIVIAGVTAIHENGLPQDTIGYLGFGAAVLRILSAGMTKDAKVSNAPVPAEPTVVK